MGIQVLLGLFRNLISGKPTDPDDPHDHGPRRIVFNALHKTNGWLLFALGLANIYLGITVFEDNVPDDDKDLWIQDPAKDLFWAYVGVALILGLILEAVHAPQWNYWICFGNNSVKKGEEGNFERKIRTVFVPVFIAF